MSLRGRPAGRPGEEYEPAAHAVAAAISHQPDPVLFGHTFNTVCSTIRAPRISRARARALHNGHQGRLPPPPPGPLDRAAF